VRESDIKCNILAVLLIEQTVWYWAERDFENKSWSAGGAQRAEMQCKLDLTGLK
jgi:hypothetical protein